MLTSKGWWTYSSRQSRKLMFNVLKCRFRLTLEEPRTLKINMGEVPRKGSESANTSMLIKPAVNTSHVDITIADANSELIHYLIALNLSAIWNNLAISKNTGDPGLQCHRALIINISETLGKLINLCLSFYIMGIILSSLSYCDDKMRWYVTGLNTVPVNYQHLEMIIYNFNCTILFLPFLLQFWLELIRLELLKEL